MKTITRKNILLVFLATITVLYKIYYNLSKLTYTITNANLIIRLYILSGQY